MGTFVWLCGIGSIRYIVEEKTCVVTRVKEHSYVLEDMNKKSTLFLCII